MANARAWEVSLSVSGPVKVREKIKFDTQKELNIGEVFTSSIEIKPNNEGFNIVATVFTTEQDSAHKVALLFVGRMLDILAIKLNSPLFVSLDDDWKYTKKSQQRAIIKKSDFQSAFELYFFSNFYRTRNRK